MVDTSFIFYIFLSKKLPHTILDMSEESLWNTNKKSDMRIFFMNKLHENIVFLEMEV